LRGSLEDTLKSIWRVLESLGYRPVVVGTYALILQGWLPHDYLYETKDVDLYVDNPIVVFDERVEEALISRGLPMGRSEAGRLYVEAAKPVEIVYPVHGIYVPTTLLGHVVSVRGLRVLEGHAVLVAKALGSSIEHLAGAIQLMGVRVDEERLRSLLEGVAGEVDPAEYSVATRRVEAFLRRYRAASTSGYEEGVMQGEG